MNAEMPISGYTGREMTDQMIFYVGLLFGIPAGFTYVISPVYIGKELTLRARWYTHVLAYAGFAATYIYLLCVKGVPVVGAGAAYITYFVLALVMFLIGALIGLAIGVLVRIVLNRPMAAS